MSISIQIAPIIRPFRGFADPAFPDGYWAAHGSVDGDASGGLQSVDIRFSQAVQPSASLLWSIEQLILGNTAEGVATIRMDFGGFDLQPLQGSTGALSKLIHIATADLGSVSAGSALNISNIERKIFLGSPRKDVNVDLSFDTANNNNQSLNVFVQGFFWGPGSLNAPGGPQRPPSSLYGA